MFRRLRPRLSLAAIAFAATAAIVSPTQANAATGAACVGKAGTMAANVKTAPWVMRSSTGSTLHRRDSTPWGGFVGTMNDGSRVYVYNVNNGIATTYVYDTYMQAYKTPYANVLAANVKC